MEQELYRLLGRLLGTLEAMATDVQEPVEGRHRAWLQQALDCGHELKDHVEALAFLASPDAGARLSRAPYSIRRMVEHAVRAAGWQAAERNIELLLPPLQSWAEREVSVDVRAMDRVIRGLCEHLVNSLPPGSCVTVRLLEVQGGLQVVLAGNAELDAPLSAPQGPPELLLSAWTQIALVHGGSLALDKAQLRAEIWLPFSQE